MDHSIVECRHSLLKFFFVLSEVFVMSLSELHDLQSRLMLIAGEADEEEKDDATRFINVLSSAENLAKAYVQLKLSGCLLFDEWFAIIRCIDLKK